MSVPQLPFLSGIKRANHGRSMGGIAVYVLPELLKYRVRIKEQCDFAIFLRIDKVLFDIDKDIILYFV